MHDDLFKFIKKSAKMHAVLCEEAKILNKIFTVTIV